MSNIPQEVFDYTILPFMLLEDIYSSFPGRIFEDELQRRLGTPEWFSFIESHPDFTHLFVKNLDNLFIYEGDLESYILLLLQSENWSAVGNLILSENREVIDHILDTIEVELDNTEGFINLLKNDKIFDIIYSLRSMDIISYCNEDNECILDLLNKFQNRNIPITQDLLTKVISDIMAEYTGRENNYNLGVELLKKENRDFLRQLFDVLEKFEEPPPRRLRSGKYIGKR